MKTILVVDDDSHIRHLVSLHLKGEGFTVIEAKNGEDALQVLESNSCDLAVVDIMMPIIDGNELTKDIRQFYDIPIILLTDKSQIEDKEKVFLSGTDDYLVKPFEPRELIYRIKALFRRYEKNLAEIITINSITINKKNYEVKINNHIFILPLKEFELLFFLASNSGKVFTRSQLIEAIWGFD